MASTGKKLLEGKKVLVTRSAHQAGEFSRILRGMGAIPLKHPVIEIKPLNSPQLRSFVERLINGEDRYDYVIFTSRNGVDAFFSLAGAKKGAEFLKKPDVVAIGPKTASALGKMQIMPHLPDADSNQLEHPAKKPLICRDHLKAIASLIHEQNI